MANFINLSSYGKTIQEAKEITWKDAAEELGGLPDVKAHCSVLAVDALREAIRDYEERHGLNEAREPTTEEVVRERLKHVMNPLTGIDVVDSDLIRETEIEDGTITISVDLVEDHQFASVVEEDIREKLGSRHDVDDIKVKFKE